MNFDSVTTIEEGSLGTTLAQALAILADLSKEVPPTEIGRLVPIRN